MKEKTAKEYLSEQLELLAEASRKDTGLNTQEKINLALAINQLLMSFTASVRQDLS